MFPPLARQEGLQVYPAGLFLEIPYINRSARRQAMLRGLSQCCHAMRIFSSISRCTSMGAIEEKCRYE